MNQFCQVVTKCYGDFCSRKVEFVRDGIGVCRRHKDSDAWPLPLNNLPWKVQAFRPHRKSEALELPLSQSPRTNL